MNDEKFVEVEDNKITEETTPEEVIIDLSEPKPPKKSGGFKSLIYFIVSLFIIVLGTAIVLNLIRNKWEEDRDFDNPNSSSTVSVAEGDHYPPKYTERENITFEQFSQPQDPAYSSDELFNLARAYSVEIYSFKSNQVVTADKTASGVIITDDGYIVTNAHVVKDCTNFIISLGDGREFEAAFVGSDEKTDLAVLKIDAENLTYAKMGICDEMKIGDTVAALGNAGGFAGTFTTGVVSGKNRLIGSDKDIYSIHHIQVDASLNAGNSGGALMNIYGQIIGIVDSKYIANNSEGLGFAISIDEAVPILEELISNGKITSRVKIGFIYSTVSEQRAKITEQKAGMHVTEISEDKPVASSGLKVDDVIIAIDGVNVLENDNLRSVIKSKRAEDEIVLTVVRGEETLTITTTVTEYTEN